MGKLKTEDAEALLKKLLKENEFDLEKLCVKPGWEVFKLMSSHEFDCAQEDLLFEAGVYDAADEDVFYLSFVRQFIINVEDEYDYIEQLHMEFLYPLTPELREISETIWTYDFDGDFGNFFEAVEASPVFRLLQEKFVPMDFDLYMDEV